MKPAVEGAIAQLRAAFPCHDVKVLADADGGAYVIVEAVDIGAGFAPRVTWIGFQITWLCPDPDVYPHFIDQNIKYIGDGLAPVQHPEGNLPTAMSRGAQMPGFDLPAIQVSRKSNHHDPKTDSPLTKLWRVVDFLEDR
jgi:hypothetical protein